MTVKRRISLYLKGEPKAAQVPAIIELEMPNDAHEFEHAGVRYRITADATIPHQQQTGPIVTEASEV